MHLPSRKRWVNESEIDNKIYFPLNPYSRKFADGVRNLKKCELLNPINNCIYMYN